MPPSDQTRLLVIEDVPQVAQHIRTLLNAQTAIRLLDVVPDGAQAGAMVVDLRPDVVIVDGLLQGKVRAGAVVDQIRRSGVAVPIILLTVPQSPVNADPERSIGAVLMMPFTGYDLVNTVQQVRADFAAASGETSQTIAVFSPKGGTGRTTLAVNLAVAIRQLGRKTALVDGALQFADLRGVLKVPADAPSILELPTANVSGSDLDEVLWRDPSGIDILMAPSRIEMAEMVTARDMEKVLAMLRRIYSVIVVDMSPVINEVNLALLDQATTILEVLTLEPAAIRSAGLLAATFEQIGYPPEKIQYLVNRVDDGAPELQAAFERTVGRPPDHVIQSDARLARSTVVEGLPFVLAEPDAPISREVSAVAAAIAGRAAVAAAGRR